MGAGASKQRPFESWKIIRNYELTPHESNDDSS